MDNGRLVMATFDDSDKLHLLHRRELVKNLMPRILTYLII